MERERAEVKIMNNSNLANAKARKPLPKTKRLLNSGMLQRGGAAAGGPQTGFTCNPCIQTENDQCFYTRNICPSVNRC